MKSSSFFDNLLRRKDLALAPGTTLAVHGHDGLGVAVADPGVRPLTLGAVHVIVGARHNLGEARC